MRRGFNLISGIIAASLLLFLLCGCTPKPQGFTLKGMKGYGWTPEVCAEEVATLKEYGMNFFAPCYLSFFDKTDVETFEQLDGHNRWWEPMDDDLQARWRRVVRECRNSDIEFCFGMNPMLFSPRPLDTANEADFEALLAKYRWFQEQGVKWFYIAIDDLHLQSHLEIDAVGQSLFTNKLYAALKKHDSECRMIFCPTWYRGRDLELPHKRIYLENIAETLNKDIFVFWVGHHTVSPEIAVEDVLRYKEVVKHEMILWDNYPVNDYHNTLYVGPLTGREAGLSEVLYGMMANPMRDNRMTRLPLYTIADFMNNPYDYNPEASIAKAIAHIAHNETEAQLLTELVGYYSSNFEHGQNSTKYNHARAQFERYLSEDKAAAAAFAEGLSEFYGRFCEAFATDYAHSKRVIAQDVEWMKASLATHEDK